MSQRKLPSVEKAEAPKTVAMERGMASCSVNSPSIVKRGTSTAPPPMPAAEARTVARKTATEHWMSDRPRGKSESDSPGPERRGGRKRT